VERPSEVGFSESGNALVHSRRVKYREIKRQGLSYPKSLRRVIGEIVVGQLMEKRPEPTRFDLRENRRQRPPVEVNLELRDGMRSNWPVCHLPYKDDPHEVTRTPPRSQIGMQLLGGGTIRGIVVDVSVEGIV